jgi:hemolysin-activating ACP:hemolysin acyltransferase
LAQAERQKPKVSQLKPTMEALGVVLSFICMSAPYAEFRAAKIIKAVQQQLSSGCHVCLIEDDRLVAYAGWLPVDVAEAERWMEGNTNLHPVPSSSTDAAALTIVSVHSPLEIPQLIRACRKRAPQRKIYFKRDYSGGRTKKTKVTDRK